MKETESERTIVSNETRASEPAGMADISRSRVTSAVRGPADPESFSCSSGTSPLPVCSVDELQACVLHDCVCGDAGQAAPPPLATCVTAYDRDCDPPPQPAEQVLQLPQLPVQLTAGGGDGGGTAPATVIVLATSVW